MARPTTMADVAKAAGVSRALVSLAYRDAPGVSTATRERILTVGVGLGYLHNRTAASLAGRGGDTVGVFLQDLRNDVFADMHDGLRETVEGAGRHLVLTVGTIDGREDVAALTTLRQRRVDVIVAAGLQLPDIDVRTVADHVPIVSVARVIEGVDSVSTDNLLGAGLATRHLLELGHRRIAFLANPPSDGYLDRGAGFADAMRDAGLQPRAVVTTYARRDAAADATKLLGNAEAPTAIIAHNDQAALGVLDALAMRGLIAGRDVSVIGYDNSASSNLPGIPLTTVDIHAADLGRRAGKLAVRRLAGAISPPTLEVIKPDLIVRSTTGPPRST